MLCLPEAGAGTSLSRAVRSYEILDLVEQAERGIGRPERQFIREGQSFYARAMRLLPDQPWVALEVRDVTELQRLGRARRDFVANISHDLRTPIAAILVMVETLQGAAADSPKRRHELVKGIADQTATLQQMAEELLDLSLIESGRMPLRLVVIPVSELVEPVLLRMQPQAEHKGQHLSQQYDRDLRVLADPDSIRRVLQNLMHNAIKFTPTGGSITIER